MQFEPGKCAIKSFSVILYSIVRVDKYTKRLPNFIHRKGPIFNMAIKYLASMVFILKNNDVSTGRRIYSSHLNYKNNLFILSLTKINKISIVRVFANNH